MVLLPVQCTFFFFDTSLYDHFVSAATDSERALSKAVQTLNLELEEARKAQQKAEQAAAMAAASAAALVASSVRETSWIFLRL